MDLHYLSLIINILLVFAFIADRIYRLKSIKEYKEAKEAQIENLKQQLENVQNNTDIQISEMHKKRYENLKVILDEKELELNINEIALLEIKTAFENASEKAGLADMLLTELNRVERQKHDLEKYRKVFLNPTPYNLNDIPKPLHLSNPNNAKNL